MSPQTVKKEKKKKAKKAKEAVETADQPGDGVCRAAPIGLLRPGWQAGLDRGGNSGPNLPCAAPFCLPY